MQATVPQWCETAMQRPSGDRIPMDARLRPLGATVPRTYVVRGYSYDLSDGNAAAPTLVTEPSGACAMEKRVAVAAAPTFAPEAASAGGLGLRPGNSYGALGGRIE